MNAPADCLFEEVKPVSRKIRVAHSPDSDDAFMFYALANGKLDSGAYEFVHELHDIETLNQAAFEGRYEVSAISFHAYCHLADRYAILPHGASFGDGYGARRHLARTHDAGDAAERGNRDSRPSDDGISRAAPLSRGRCAETPRGAFRPNHGRGEKRDVAGGTPHS